LTPAQIIATWRGSSTTLQLPHPMHCTATTSGHRERLDTIETMKVLEGRRAHLAHLQFHAYGGDD
jgi:formylmethanofuran dehydrogenase subunit A